MRLGMWFMLRFVPAASMLLEALRILLRLRTRAERTLLFLPVRRLQRRDVLERVAQRPAAMPGPVQLPRRLGRARRLLELWTEWRAVRLRRWLRWRANQ